MVKVSKNGYWIWGIQVSVPQLLDINGLSQS
jgi:hypothetical protein